MPTIDLTTPRRRDVHRHRLEAAPRRLGLTLPELQEAALRAGGAPLPFDLAAPTGGGTMGSRLGPSPAEDDDAAFRRALAGLHDPIETLTRRGLLEDGVLEPGLAGAIGLLATPDLAIDLDVRFADAQAHAWHRRGGEAVAALATSDGIVFELAWFAADDWAAELARTAALSEDVALTASAVPTLLDLPRELAEAGAEAVRTGRGDLLPVLASRHSGQVLGADGPLSDAEVVAVLTALGGEARGRLRALVAETGHAGRIDRVGVAAWSLLADGWHSLRPHRVDGVERIEVSAVTSDDLAACLSPVVAGIRSNGGVR